MTHTDDTCPECKGEAVLPPTAVRCGCETIVILQARLCPACNGTGKQPISELPSAHPPNAAPHEHAEVEEAAYLEETSNG